MTATPILDLAKDPPQPRRTVRRFIIQATIGALIGISLVLTPNLPGSPSFNFLVWILAVHVMILLHELGHLVAGIIVGMPPGGIRVGCFQALRSGERWVFRLDWKGLLSGIAVPLPPQNGFRASDFAWMVAGGPIVSIISIAACWGAWLRYGNGAADWIGSSFWAAGIGLFSLIPLSSGVHKSDAARLWMLLRNPGQAEAWMALIAVNAENITGVRPRDWTASLVEKMMSAPLQNSAAVVPELLCYCRLLDQGHEESALTHLENCLASSEKAGAKIRQTLYLEAAGAVAFHRHNAGHARTWQERAIRLGQPESRAGSSAAISICEGRYADALREIEEARQYIAKRNPGAGIAILALERLDRREQECRAAIANGAANAAGA